jgi:DNA-binding FrmR family transcriptional regulator
MIQEEKCSGDGMSLRFQDYDEIDREVKAEKRRSGLLFVLFFCLIAAAVGLHDWLHGDSLKSHEGDLGWLVAALFVVWLVGPLFFELSKRLKEIDGKVSVTESAINESVHDKEILNRIYAIEGSLNEIHDELRKINSDNKESCGELQKRSKAIEDKSNEIRGNG